MPHSPPSPFGWLGALVIAVAATSCSRPSPENQANVLQPAEPEPVANESETELAEAPLDRERLIVTFLEASGSAVIGADDATAQKALKGKRFELRMRFGCPAGQPSTRRNWSYDQNSRALKVVVKPDVDEEVEVPVGPPPPDGRRGETAMVHRSGFIIPAPTLFQSGCPTEEFAVAAGFTNLRFGIVQTTDPEAPRARQLLDSYEIVKKIAPEAKPKQGLELIIRGRLEFGESGRSITCAPKGGVVECLAAATIDQVSIEDPANSRLIAEWAGN